MNAPLLTVLLTLGTGHILALEVDPVFHAQAAGTVHAIATTPSGQIIIGGEFDSINGIARTNLARLDSDGSLDTSFDVGADGAVLCLAAFPDGSVYGGGAFSLPSHHLFRLLPNGQVDANFGSRTGTSSRIQCLGLASGGALFVGGPFRQFHNSPANYVAKVIASGALDATFVSALSRTYTLEAGAHAVALQPDGKIVVVGNVGVGNDLACVVRLNANGSLDASFSGDPGPMLYSKCVATLPEGKILVGGTAPDGKGFIRRLNANGAADPSFNAPTFSDSIETFALAEDGQIYIGGNFDGKLARLNVDGTVDKAWHILADGTVKALVFDSNGDVLVGGAFTEIGGQERRGIARIKIRGTFRTFATNENGRFLARLKAEPGRAYQVESSEDLRTWSGHSVAVATESGLVISEPALGRKHRFFRARLIE